MDATLTERWLRLATRRVGEKREWLTDLDRAIGDGDHGINLDRGFAAVLARLDAGELPTASGAALVTAAGRVVTGTVGGASGALYGQALLHAGGHLAAAPARSGRPDADRMAGAIEAAVDAIARLGRARPGEKTMLDALVPAATAMRRAADAGATPRAVALAGAEAAETGARATLPLLALKGRASYLGPRSVGHLDPGAASSAILVRALSDVLAGA